MCNVTKYGLKSPHRKAKKRMKKRIVLARLKESEKGEKKAINNLKNSSKKEKKEKKRQ